MGVLAMAALVVLAGCLPGDAKLSRDFRPADAQADSMIDQRFQLCLCLLQGTMGGLDLLEDLGLRLMRSAKRRVCSPYRRLLLLLTAGRLDSRVPLRAGHAIQDASLV